MRVFLLVAVLGGFLIAALWFAVDAWIRLGDVEISAHGIFAMVLGIVLTFAVGAGLMAALFHSSRSGHDEAVGLADRHDRAAHGDED